MLDPNTIEQICSYIKEGKLDILKELDAFSKNADLKDNINQKNKQGVPFFIYALIYRKAEIANWFLMEFENEIDVNASIDIKDFPAFGGYNALFMAVLKHQPPECDLTFLITKLCVNTRLNLNAKLTQKGYEGCNILHFAAKLLIDGTNNTSTSKTNLATMITTIIGFDKNKSLVTEIHNNKTILDRINTALKNRKEIETELKMIQKAIIEKGGTTAAQTPKPTPMPTPAPTPQLTPQQKQKNAIPPETPLNTNEKQPLLSSNQNTTTTLFSSLQVPIGQLQQHVIDNKGIMLKPSTPTITEQNSNPKDNIQEVNTQQKEPENPAKETSTQSCWESYCNIV